MRLWSKLKAQNAVLCIGLILARTYVCIYLCILLLTEHRAGGLFMWTILCIHMGHVCSSVVCQMYPGITLVSLQHTEFLFDFEMVWYGFNFKVRKLKFLVCSPY